jgi:hypothetical protein
MDLATLQEQVYDIVQQVTLSNIWHLNRMINLFHTHSNGL